VKPTLMAKKDLRGSNGIKEKNPWYQTLAICFMPEWGEPSSKGLKNETKQRYNLDIICQNEGPQLAGAPTPGGRRCWGAAHNPRTCLSRPQLKEECVESSIVGGGYSRKKVVRSHSVKAFRRGQNRA